MANSSGTYETTPARTMKAFDKLPPEVRKLLAESIESWAVQPILTKIRRGYKINWEERISNWNKEAAEEHWYRMFRLQEKGVDYNVAIRRKRKG